jgi:hypothetical protein
VAPPVSRQLTRASYVFPAPTLDAKGRPTAWTHTSETIEDWGTLRVVFNGVDVTFLRDVPTIVESFGSAEPLGDTSAVIRFPQITPFEALGTGDLAAITDWVDVEIKRLHPDGATLSTLWEGLAAGFDERSDGLTVVCLGALHQLDLYVRAPGISDEALDIRALIANEFEHDNRPAMRAQELATTPATGVTSRVRGAWESPAQYIARLLDGAYNGSGVQWTVRHDRPRQPVLALKDRTTEHWTVRVGQPGVVHDLTYEPREAANVIYGEGVDQGGNRWRNSFPDQPTSYPFFQPLSYDTTVHGFDENAAGDLVDNRVRVDASKIRIETLTTFGEGFGLAEAKSVAGTQRSLRGTPAWVGEIRLTADPNQGGRLEIVAGQNVRLQSFRGSASGLLLHIAAVRHELTPEGYTTTLTVDEKGRDAALIDLIRDRNAEAARNPVSRLMVGKDSGANLDSQVPWDAEAGSGFLPNDTTHGHRHKTGTSTVPLAANTWSVVRILASQKDTIVHTEFVVSPAAAFHVSIYDRFVATGDLPSDPFADGAWDSPPDGYIVGWGQFGQVAGYYPGLETDGGTPTGILKWEDTWQYHHDDVSDRDALPYLWVAIRAKAAASIWGRLTRGVGYG